MLIFMCLTGNATLDPSTVFVDFLGPLGGDSAATWNNAAANKAVDAERLEIQSAVRKGLIARAAADWHVSVLTGRLIASLLLVRLQTYVMASNRTLSKSGRSNWGFAKTECK